MNSSEESPGNLNGNYALKLAPEKPRSNIVTDLAGHPSGMLSLEELEFFNPRLSENGIHAELERLESVSVDRVTEFDPGKELPGYPDTFYSLNDEARTLFNSVGLFPEDALKRQQASVNKPPRIEQIQKMPRLDN